MVDMKPRDVLLVILMFSSVKMLNQLKNSRDMVWELCLLQTCLFAVMDAASVTRSFKENFTSFLCYSEGLHHIGKSPIHDKNIT